MDKNFSKIKEQFMMFLQIIQTGEATVSLCSKAVEFLNSKYEDSEEIRFAAKHIAMLQASYASLEILHYNLLSESLEEYTELQNSLLDFKEMFDETLKTSIHKMNSIIVQPQ